MTTARHFVHYDPAPEDRSLARLEDAPTRAFIAGAWRDAADGAAFTTYEPATGRAITQVAHCGPADIDAAVDAATAAAPGWADRPELRSRVLFRAARLLAERSRELAVLETIDNGKPIRETRDVDVPLAAQWLFHHAGWADKLSHVGLGDDPRPHGVVAAVVPWNFPLLMATWKLGPALAAGNTVVLKPAETTPLSALRLAEILAEAGVPDGVVNVVPGDGTTGAALVRHDGIDKVAFTGSTAVGRDIAAALAGTRKHLTLELGGKSAMIVFADADLDRAVEGVVDAVFFNQGHVCCAGSRLLVAEPIAARFTAKLSERMRTLRVGDPLDKNTDIGAVNSPAQLASIEAHIRDARDAGVEILTTGCDLPGSGNYCAPALLVGVAETHRAWREEIFGPVVAMSSFRSADEAVERANNTAYGLAASVWTGTGSLATWTARRLRAGVVWVNSHNRFAPNAPFGGIGESGYGREGGRSGMEAYLAH